MMKAKFKLGILILGIVGSAWGQLISSHAPTTAAPPSAKPVVRVNGTVLTDRDLVREEYAIFPYARQHNGVPAAMEADIRAGALKMIEFEELVYQEALRRGMIIAPQRFEKAEAEFRKQFSSRQQYDQVLASEFQGSNATLRSKIKRSLLIEDLLKQEVENKSAVSIAETRDYYDKNPQRFQYPEAFVFQSISFLPPANATSGQVSEVIEFDTSQFTILRLKEHINRGERTFEQVQPSVREWLRKQKSEQRRKDLDAKLRKHAKVEEL